MRAAHQDADFSRTHVLEQNVFLHVTVEILHEGDLLGGDAAPDKFCLQIVISAKLSAQF